MADKTVTPLIPTFDEAYAGDFSEEYLAIAYQMECALISAGATPHEDYTYLDLFQLAQPFVLELFQNGRIKSWDYPARRIDDAQM